MHQRLIMRKIPVAGPWVTEKEVAYVADAAANAWYENANTYNLRFEKLFAEYCDTAYAVTLPHCTAAIHLSLLALGVRSGDEVIVPDGTWIASAAPVSYVGATPVFVDIDRYSWCMDAKALEAAITPRTKAIIPVDLYGNMPDMDAILAVADAQGIPVVEDAAEALGSEYKGRKAGSFGLTGVFSFHGSKTLTTGEGGMLVTSDKAIYDRILFLRDHGRPLGDRMFYNTEVAFKYKMSAFQAAFGLAQLERIDELIARKLEIFEWYRMRLAHVSGLTLNHSAPGTKNTYWMVTILLDPALRIGKLELMQALSERGIDSRTFFHPLSSLPAYEGTASAACAREANAVAYDVCPRGVNLPSGYNLTEEDVDYVCASLLKIIGNASP
jgi:perosamine synthetase